MPDAILVNIAHSLRFSRRRIKAWDDRPVIGGPLRRKRDQKRHRTDIAIACLGLAAHGVGSWHIPGGAEEQHLQSIGIRCQRVHLLDREARQCNVTREANNDGNQSICLFRAVFFFFDWRSEGAGPANAFAYSIFRAFK